MTLDAVAYALAAYTVVRWIFKAIWALVKWNDRRHNHREQMAAAAQKAGMQRNPRYSPAGLATFGPAHGKTSGVDTGVKPAGDAVRESGSAEVDRGS